jgi:transposase-like protein
MKCPRCESTQINKNGHHHGKQNYLCKQCGRQFVEFYEFRGYSHDVKKICLRMHANGIGFREIERLTDVNHNTIISWVRQAENAASQRSEPENIKPKNEVDKSDSG